MPAFCRSHWDNSLSRPGADLILASSSASGGECGTGRDPSPVSPGWLPWQLGHRLRLCAGQARKPHDRRAWHCSRRLRQPARGCRRRGRSHRRVSRRRREPVMLAETSRRTAPYRLRRPYPPRQRAVTSAPSVRPCPRSPVLEPSRHWRCIRSASRSCGRRTATTFQDPH